MLKNIINATHFILQQPNDTQVSVSSPINFEATEDIINTQSKTSSPLSAVVCHNVKPLPLKLTNSEQQKELHGYNKTPSIESQR